MPAVETYRKFWLETQKYDFPERFGFDWFTSALDKVWEEKSALVNWAGLESCLRDCLESSKLTDEQKVRVVREAIAAFTRRG